ncbi:hypothetical protein [Sorangium sp. So ce233]|uniref:hypothetical protein n=1 Tax=Sorangium sp. So ce233 TaxID=3133290 RepID=UPI003F60BF77
MDEERCDRRAEAEARREEGVIELVDAAIGAAGVGVVAAAAGVRRFLKTRRDERAQVIAMGEGMDIEYVPGEELEYYRDRVIRRRDALADKEARKRERDEKGRFV